MCQEVQLCDALAEIERGAGEAGHFPVDDDEFRERGQGKGCAAGGNAVEEETGFFFFCEMREEKR